MTVLGCTIYYRKTGLLATVKINSPEHTPTGPLFLRTAAAVRGTATLFAALTYLLEVVALWRGGVPYGAFASALTYLLIWGP